MKPQKTRSLATWISSDPGVEFEADLAQHFALSLTRRGEILSDKAYTALRRCAKIPWPEESELMAAFATAAECGPGEAQNRVVPERRAVQSECCMIRLLICISAWASRVSPARQLRWRSITRPSASSVMILT